MLTEEQVWNSDSIMAANCKAGLAMPALMQIVGAVEAEVCRAQDDRSSGLTNGRITELAMTHAHADDFARAIEAEVRAEAKGPVTNANDTAKLRFFRDMTSAERRKVFEVFGIESAVLNEVRSLSDETRLFNHLFTAPQPPAPCQSSTDTEYYRAECERLQAKVAELEQFKQMWAISCAERDALQAKVAILDGLSQVAIDGGWTYRGIEAYAKGLEAKVAEQAAEIERLTGCLSRANDQAERFEREWYLRGDTIAQQSALINKLERCIECYIVQFEAECKALDEKDALIEEQCQVVQNFGSTE